MTTLGPSKGLYPLKGSGLRWLKIRQGPLSPKAPLTVAYSIWRTTGTSYLCGVHITVRDDNRHAAARAVRDARRRVWSWEDREAARAAEARARATEARAVARRALG